MSYIKYLYRLFKFLGNATRASSSIAFCGHYAISIYIDSNLRLWWPILNFWLVALCDLDTGLHRCGKWSEGWVNSSWVMVAMICSPCCPAQIFPFLLSYLSIQCNLNQGAVPLFLHSLCSRSPLLVFSNVTVKREWPSWVGLTDRVLTPHCRHPVSTCHPQLPTFWPLWHQGQNRQRHSAMQ